MVKYSEFSPSLFVFPAVLFPTCATLVLCALYGSLALWLIRAVLQELRVSREARRKTSKGTGRTREPTSHGSSHAQGLTTRAHVLCIVCAASIFSFGYGALKFVPTLVHIVLHDEVFTVCVSIGYRLLGAAADSLWFFASSQLVAYWLELLTSMRSVKRVRKCCWFSIATALPFTLLRTAAAIAAPLTHPSVHVTLIVAAVGIAWILVAVGIASGLKLACHMRRLVAKNRAAKIVRAKMSRTGRFLAINLALFVLLSLALVLAAVGRVMRDLELQCFYMGEVKDGYPHGHGIATWRECVVYEGKWMNGRCREQRGALRGTKNVTLFALFQKAERALSCEWRATYVAGCVRLAACNLFVFLPCNLFFFCRCACE